MRSTLAFLTADAVNFVSAAVVLLGAALSPILEAQAPLLPEFDVVSIKPRPPRTQGFQFKPWMPTFQCDPLQQCGVNGSRFREVSVSLADLIMDAYSVRRFQIIGLPAWGDSGQDFFDVEATVKNDVTPTVDQARLMLQSVLAERFQLRLRREARELPVYALVAGKNGVKVIPGEGVCGARAKKREAERTANGAPPEYRFPWLFFSALLSIRIDRPVIDKTGLDGVGYCTTDEKSPTLAILEEIDRGASVFAAVEERWGMRLEPQRAPVEVLVIESVMRPSEN